MEKTSTHVAATRTSPTLLRPFAATALLLLVAQFLVGMLVNLFVTVPVVHPGTNAANYFVGVVQGVLWALSQGTMFLLLHAVIGLLLFLCSSILIGLATASRQRAWIIVSIIGWVGIVGAGFNGASFMNYGHNFSSLIMSILFLLAVISYAVGFYVTR